MLMITIPALVMTAIKEYDEYYDGDDANGDHDT